MWAQSKISRVPGTYAIGMASTMDGTVSVYEGHLIHEAMICLHNVGPVLPGHLVTPPMPLAQGAHSPYCLSDLLLHGILYACSQQRALQISAVLMHVGAHLPKIRAVPPGHAVCLSVPLAEGVHSRSCVSDLPLVRIGQEGQEYDQTCFSRNKRYVHDVMSNVLACL